MKKKKEKHYVQKLIPWIIVAVLGYTIAAFLLQFIVQVEVSPTLTTCYFAFWGTEIVAMATIKSVKESKKSKREESEE
jgi:hypothetical protein